MADSITLPGGTKISTGDKINFRNTLGQMRKGQVGRIRENLGEFGWINVLDSASKQYEDISLAVQLQHVGEENILIK